MAPRTPKVVSSLVNDVVVAVRAVDDAAVLEEGVDGAEEDMMMMSDSTIPSPEFLNEDSRDGYSKFLGENASERDSEVLDSDSTCEYSTLFLRILDEDGDSSLRLLDEEGRKVPGNSVA